MFDESEPRVDRGSRAILRAMHYGAREHIPDVHAELMRVLRSEVHQEAAA